MMDQLQQWIDEIVKLLTGGWPVSAVIIAVIYRDEIRQMLPRLRKAGPVELDPVQLQETATAATAPADQLQGLDFGPPASPFIIDIENNLFRRLDAKGNWFGASLSPLGLFITSRATL